MTEAFDTARAELLREIECHEHEIGLLSNKLLSQQIERDKCAAFLQGMDRAHRLLTEAATEPAPERPAEPAPPPERKRRDVQGAVMELFAGDEPAALSEDTIVRFTNLPIGSVHQFLLRAVRDGRLIRDGDLYRLPQPEPVARDNPGAGAEPEVVIQPVAKAPKPEAKVGPDDEGRTVGSIPATGAATDARVLSSAEFVDQSNALRAALEAAGPDGIVAEKAMVAPEVIEEACIAGWCQKGHDPFRHEPWLYWMPEAAPQAEAAA